MQDKLITGPRKKTPKLLAFVDKGKCFGRGCEMCIHVCPVKDCIYLVPDPEPGAMGEVCEIDVDTCIGCQLCVKFCPPDYDAVHMFPHDEGIRLGEEEDRSYDYRLYDKKKGGALAR